MQLTSRRFCRLEAVQRLKLNKKKGLKILSFKLRVSSDRLGDIRSMKGTAVKTQVGVRKFEHRRTASAFRTEAPKASEASLLEVINSFLANSKFS